MRRDIKTYVAPVTPITLDGEIDVEAIGPLYRFLSSRGADGFYVGGGTGQGIMLTVRQRQRLLEEWRKAAGPLVPLIAHITCASLDDSRRLARHASELGVTAISAMGPTIFTPGDASDLVGVLADLTEAAPQTPFYFYLNSAIAGGLKISGFDFLTAARSALPTLAGIKFTHEDLMDLSRCLRFDHGRFRIYYGKDEFLLGALAVGATDFIGGAFNVVLPLAREVIGFFNSGNIASARAANHRLVDVIAVLRQFGGLTAVKAAMELLGVPCGPLLRPLRTSSESEKIALRDALYEAWPEFNVATGKSPRAATVA